MTQEFVTLPREVVERALECLDSAKVWKTLNLHKLKAPHVSDAAAALRTALEQPDVRIRTSVPDGWKLVPAEPTPDMQEAGIDAHYEAEKKMQEPNAWEPGGFAERKVRASHVYRAMIAAAPQPPAPGCKATKRGEHVVCDDCKSAWEANDKNPPACALVPPALEQPQGEQEPVAYYVERHAPGMRDNSTKLGPFWKRKSAEGWLDEHHQLRALYTRPQPLQPLTEEKIARAVRPFYSSDQAAVMGLPDDVCTARAIEAAHNIK